MSLNELITRNAWRAFKSHQQNVANDGGKFKRADLVSQMANYLIDKDGKSFTRARVRMALKDYFPQPPGRPDREWRIDYLAAFSAVVETPVYRLAHHDYDGKGKMDEVSYEHFYATIVGRALSPKQISKFNKDLKAELAIPGMFELVDALCDDMRVSKSRDEAIGKAVVSIQKARVWGHTATKTKKARVRK